ncbi:MAG: phosphatase PAP2 family protein [Myxococcales bacterium]
MKHWLGILTLLLAWLGSQVSGAHAQEEISCEGPLQGDELRFPNARVAPRTLADLAAVPASVVAWDGGDWARFGAIMAPTVALMVPANPSLDVRFQDWLAKRERPSLDRLFVKIKTVPEGVALGVYGAIIFSAAYVRNDKRLFEYGTLALEALGIQQFYHITTKLLLGRESPYQGNGQGDIHGPTVFSFPGGTPSGHASTAFAMLAVLAEYWNAWPLYVLAGVGGVYVSSALLYEKQHFLSDVVIGAGMGWYIGRWIVRHRSSRYRCRAKTDQAWYQKVMWLPMASSSGLGLGVSYRY